MFSHGTVVNNGIVLFRSSGHSKLKYTRKLTVVVLDTLELKPETVVLVHEVY